METFDITVETPTGPAHLDIRPLNKKQATEYEVWNEDNLLFTLRFESIRGTYVLVNPLEGKVADPEVVRKVSEKLQQGK